MFRKTMSIALLCSLFAISFQCQKGHKKISLTAQFEPYIAGYTSGVISREAIIRIALYSDAVPDSIVGKTIQKSLFDFRPSIKGSAVWSDRRTIEFRPSQHLKEDQKYNARFDLGSIVKVPSKLKTFDFTFSTIAQSFDVRLNGLAPMSTEQIQWLRLSGSVFLADIDEPQKVEKVVTVKQGNNRLSIRWEHDSRGLEHTFTVDSIQRGEDSSKIVVAWNGAPLDVKKDGSQELRIPSINEFSILETQAVTGTDLYIVIRFSDYLQKNQDLQGLIQLENDASPRFSINQNEIRVYPSERLGGQVQVTINPGIANSAGRKLKETVITSVTIENIKPAVRFVGKGIIIPGEKGQTIPFEAVNLSAVDVRATRIYENNIPQFLQVNDLDGTNELNRVGRVSWKKTVRLDITPAMKNRWVQCAFDVSELIKKDPNALYRIELTFSKDFSLYPCGGDTVELTTTQPTKQSKSFNEDEMDETAESSSWDYAEEYYSGDEESGSDHSNFYENRENPCHAAYYSGYYTNRSVARNFLLSNIGLTAKRGSVDSLYVVVSNIASAQPLDNVSLTVLNYQNQPIGKGKSSNGGFCAIGIKGVPFLLIADNGNQKGFLKLDDGSSLPVSQFDVGGAQISKGLKGYLYGERGVWRPGDSLHLVFVLDDRAKRLPEDHPVTLELINPKGQKIQTITRTEATNRLYSFPLVTSPEAPTGEYIAKVSIGGASFETVLKIENVVPNRLKVKLDFKTDTLYPGNYSGTLNSRWLHGAIAQNLKSDVEMSLASIPTVFQRYTDYVFDDPTKSFSSETENIFDGSLDEEGNASVDLTVSPKESAPGLLRASFKSRVFEEGGSFSVDRFSLPYSPFKTYVGIATPKGDKARGMLLTDTTQTVKIVTVNAYGKPVGSHRIQMKLFQLSWQWWWEKGTNGLTDFMSSNYSHFIFCDTITVKNGIGSWDFMVKYPEWGRYMIYAVDLDGGHSTGKITYIDWPGWAGRARKDNPAGASILAFSADKTQYTVGEKASINVPSSAGGKVLISLENGSRIVRQFWTDTKEKETEISFDITDDMAPTTYVYAMYVQPYAQTSNDLPVRMYGIIPLQVVYPKSKLKPIIESADVFRPGENASIAIKEKSGREMTYTLAIVDEGLLDLTRFQTPDLWEYFYQREALGIKTWDLYDLITGATNGKLDRLLSIGGDEQLGGTAKKRANRFPPMVRFIGPFTLKSGSTDKHTISIPQYVGSVRIMAVAAIDGAYGSADKSVAVRKPLMILGTLPRVLGPTEMVKLPVTIFAMEKSIRDVKLEISVTDNMTITSSKSKTIQFNQPGDETVDFELQSRSFASIAKVKILATSGSERAEQQIEIDIRNPSLPQTVVFDTTLSSNGTWKAQCPYPGVKGTNSATLEVSRVPPMDLARRLGYLIHYPYGCVEQTTSSVFPQLYLDKVVELSSSQYAAVQQNVQAGIQRLQLFQTSRGGFSYWPGERETDNWASNYAGHFLTEAKNRGYTIPAGMLDQWIRYQRSVASAWSGSSSEDQLTQAYRLYTIALANNPDLGAMNRLRESGALPTAVRWRLAAAYLCAGQQEAANALLTNIPKTISTYSEADATYGSDTRDRAMILETMVLMKNYNDAIGLSQELSKEMASESWYSTQTTAYTLCAIGKLFSANSPAGEIDISYSLDNLNRQQIKSPASILQQELLVKPDKSSATIELLNKSKSLLYVRLITKGKPEIGKEVATSQGVSLNISYHFPSKGEETEAIDITKIIQGTDFIAHVTVSADSKHALYRQLALENIFPSGWEIRNTRFEGVPQDRVLKLTYQDIRDDRVISFFDLKAGETKEFDIQLNASYLGKFYLPASKVEAMYDASISAVLPGQWVEVVMPGK